MRYFLSFFVFLMLLSGCEKADNKPVGTWSESVFIINEGPFPAGTGTISAIDTETLEITQDLFGTVNGRPLGNVVQSLTVHGDKAFIVVNNAGKIEVVNLQDFISVATIEITSLPRYFIGIDNKTGYVSCWDATVKVINLESFKVTKSVPAGAGPDEMVISGDKLFVINSGGFGVDSTVSVISTTDNVNVRNITVGYRPSGIRKDVNGKIWILCSGKGWNGYPAPDDTPAKLVCLDPSTFEILKEIVFPDTENHPDALIINGDGDLLYYNHAAGIFSFPVTGSALNEQPLITEVLFSGTSLFYGLGYDSKEDIIYGTDPLDYSQSGWVYRYHAGDGSLIDSFLAGVIPSGFWFNE
jgi:hypothetical protein